MLSLFLCDVFLPLSVSPQAEDRKQEMLTIGQFFSLLRYVHKQESHGPHLSPEKPVQISEYKIGPVFQDEKILNFENVLLQFCYYLPM